MGVFASPATEYFDSRLMNDTRKPYQIYLFLVSSLGLLLSVWGIRQLFAVEDPVTFLLLALLATGAQMTATLLMQGGISVSVSSTISLAIVPLYGPVLAAFSAALAEAGLWLINAPKDRTSWKGTLSQLTFNMGMNASALYLAGLAFGLIQTALSANGWLGESVPWLGESVPWLAGAIVSDQVNIWLLIVIIYLQQGIAPFEIWLDHRWAMSINVVVMSVGGALLAVAVQEYGLLGIGIFFLPILLSGYAFRLYVRRTQEQMGHLEEIVAARTQALADANKELAELNEQKDAFLAVLTHDMRSPLTNIHGYATMLRDHPEFAKEQQKQMLDVILRNEEALLEIVNNILDIEHLESGAPILLERENFDLQSAIMEVVESSEAQAREKQIELNFSHATAPLIVHADRSKMIRIMQNLISNAIKYTPERGQVCVQSKMNGSKVIIDVEDSGYGIPADEMPHIFDRFSRVAKHRSKAVGTGLGLAIVKNLVEAHDGEIEVASTEGQGSTFTVRLPA